ncbi:MAG: hypothetical protein KAS93_05610 [Gammaproteobacteria bacterium]|nr:hypothetical protein [Gammaproteobacteria bacterium]
MVRVEPLADAVTEESLAKVVFNVIPKPLPFIGELAEVTVSLPPLSLSPIVFNASLHRINNHLGVWLIKNGGLHFVNVKVGLSDLDGRVQILEGLKDGDRIVVYSQSALNSHSRIKVVKNLPGTSP